MRREVTSRQPRRCTIACRRRSRRRFGATRLTNAFRKKVENLRAAMDIHFTHYKFVRFHKTIRYTPAMEGDIASSPMMVKKLVEMAA